MSEKLFLILIIGGLLLMAMAFVASFICLVRQGKGLTSGKYIIWFLWGAIVIYAVTMGLVLFEFFAKKVYI